MATGRRPAEADGEAHGADATIDVELAAALFVPSADVGRLHSGETEAAVEELERQLAPMGVPGQCQVYAYLHGPVEYPVRRMLTVSGITSFSTSRKSR